MSNSTSYLNYLSPNMRNMYDQQYQQQVLQNNPLFSQMLNSNGYNPMNTPPQPQQQTASQQGDLYLQSLFMEFLRSPEMKDFSTAFYGKFSQFYKNKTGLDYGNSPIQPPTQQQYQQIQQPITQQYNQTPVQQQGYNNLQNNQQMAYANQHVQQQVNYQQPIQQQVPNYQQTIQQPTINQQHQQTIQQPTINQQQQINNQPVAQQINNQQSTTNSVPLAKIEVAQIEKYVSEPVQQPLPQFIVQDK